MHLLPIPTDRCPARTAGQGSRRGACGCPSNSPWEGVGRWTNQLPGGGRRHLAGPLWHESVSHRIGCGRCARAGYDLDLKLDPQRSGATRLQVNWQPAARNRLAVFERLRTKLQFRDRELTAGSAAEQLVVAVAQ